MQELLAFVGDVLVSKQGAKGFGLAYDFRLLKAPSVGGLMAIARWAAKPERQDLFLQRCIACRTCVPSGWKYTATKAAMAGFFRIQPPTCRTYLTTDFHDPAATLTTFYPPGDNGAAAQLRSRSTIGAGGSRVTTPVGQAATQVGVVRRTKTGAGCWSCFAFLRPLLEQRCTGDEQHRQALQRIQELEESNRQLEAMCGKTKGQFDFLTAAVPWFTAATAAYLLWSAVVRATA